MQEFKKDTLVVKIFPDRQSLGVAAANEVASRIKELMESKEVINIIFASAPSQNEFLAELLLKDIAWGRINAFHMDEYLGLSYNHPSSFGYYLKTHIFESVPLKSIQYINGSARLPQLECIRYARLLTEYPVDIVCLGIGENTHLAFNDPHVADFNDPKIVKLVNLDLACRTQQVNDGCFKSLDHVPEYAITITIPALLKADYAYAMVPGKTKARAIQNTIDSEISETYPSTVLRRHKHAELFIDKASAALLNVP